jgi:hypothetical protein
VPVPSVPSGSYLGCPFNALAIGLLSSHYARFLASIFSTDRHIPLREFVPFLRSMAWVLQNLQGLHNRATRHFGPTG